MKIDSLFNECLAGISPETRAEVRLNMDIANRIYDILQKKNMTQRDLAKLMGKRESEVSRWLTGEHGFTISTIAKISVALDTPIVEVSNETETKFVFVPISTFTANFDGSDKNYTNAGINSCMISYAN